MISKSENDLEVALVGAKSPACGFLFSRSFFTRGKQPPDTGSCGSSLTGHRRDLILLRFKPVRELVFLETKA